MHVASAFAGTGGREGLRAAVREAASAADTSQPQEPHWLARRATISGREFDLEADEQYVRVRTLTPALPC